MEDYKRKAANLCYAYIKKYPYPTYEDMEKLLRNDIVVWAEYGEFNHTAMKTIYENLVNEDGSFSSELPKKIGLSIFNRGGMHAMRQNFYALVAFLRKPKSKSREKIEGYILEDQAPGEIKCSLESVWDGVGTWRR